MTLLVHASDMNNFNDRGFAAIGKAFAYNFTVATVLSGFNPLNGVVVGGSCALVSLIALAVKPVFMSLAGYRDHDFPNSLSRFGNLAVVISLHSLVLSNWTGKVVDWLEVGILAAVAAKMESGTFASTPDVGCTLATMIAMQVYSLAGQIFNIDLPKL